MNALIVLISLWILSGLGTAVLVAAMDKSLSVRMLFLSLLGGPVILGLALASDDADDIKLWEKKQ